MTDQLLLYAVTEFFLSLSPGPAVLLVISTSLNRGMRASLGAGLGILSVNVVYFALSAIGVGALIASSPTLALGLKIVGCGYLAWTALTIILEVRANAKLSANTQQPARRMTGLSGGFGTGFLRGFAIQASSIKNIMIFVAIIPQFVDPHAMILPQMLGLGLVSILVEAPVLLAYGFAAYKLSSLVGSRTANLLDLIAAALLIIVAGSVAII